MQLNVLINCNLTPSFNTFNTTIICQIILDNVCERVITLIIVLFVSELLKKSLFYTPHEHLKPSMLY